MIHYPHTPITTTDDTPTLMATIEVPDNYGGLLKVSVVAVKDSDILTDAFYYITSFSKFGGDITVKTPLGIYEEDADLGSAVSITGSAGNILIEVTGVAATDIVWTCDTELLQTNGSGI